ncbi:MAG: hypothetical protein ACYDH6_17825 [Acidimicrobiales bacterium]
MTDNTKNDTMASAVDDPPGGHDPAALENVKKKMNVGDAPANEAAVADPPGGHDLAALKDAAEKIGAK